MRLTLGDTFDWFGRTVRFIKVTPKGFNFLDEQNHKCVLKQHLYDMNYSGKPIPAKQTNFQFKVPINLTRMLRKVV